MHTAPLRNPPAYGEFDHEEKTATFEMVMVC